MHVSRSRVVRVVGGAVSAIALVVAPIDAVRAACWRPPVEGAVVDEFRAPACRWCPGNRGLEYRVDPGSRVSAVETGVVTFSGIVAGTRYVVVEGADGRRVTYGRLASSTLREGDRVVRAMSVGRTARRFYFGVRVDGRYVDPARLLGELVGRRRLIPLDGRRARPAPPASLRCATTDATPVRSPPSPAIPPPVR